MNVESRLVSFLISPVYSKISLLRSPDFGGSADLATQSEYVVFSLDYLKKMASIIYINVGPVVNIALFSLVVVLGVHTTITIIKKYAP